MMMFFAPPITWAMAEMADQPAVLALTNSTGRTHTHLDWRPVEDWLGSQPFLLAKRGKRVVGALACPPDPPHTAWVRLFAASTGEAPEKVWNLLWPRTWEMLQSARVKIKVPPSKRREFAPSEARQDGGQDKRNIAGRQCR